MKHPWEWESTAAAAPPAFWDDYLIEDIRTLVIKALDPLAHLFFARTCKAHYAQCRQRLVNFDGKIAYGGFATMAEVNRLPKAKRDALLHSFTAGKAALMHGNMDLFDAFMPEFSLHPFTYTFYAAQSAPLPIVLLMHKTFPQVPVDESITKHGRLDLLRAMPDCIPWQHSRFHWTDAVAHPVSEIYDWLLRHQISWSVWVYFAAARNDNVAALQWLWDHGCPIDDVSIINWENAQAAGPETLAWLKQRGWYNA